MTPRRIAVFTGNRAEYGLQYPILQAFANDPRIDYQLIVSGAHLDPDFGGTLEEIRRDGFRIAAEVKIDMQSNDRLSTPRAIGSGVLAVTDAIDRLDPEVLVVYADRFEGFAAVIAATQMNVPTAHIEGGDLTEGGALDDSVRHAMTKLAHLHFTTNRQATARILAMGEEPWRVHTVGLPVLDLVAQGRYADAAEIAAALSLDVARPIALFTQHSVTTELDHAASQVRPSLEAMLQLAATGVQVIITYPNNDAGARAILSELDRIREADVPGITMRRSLGRHLYHGILALARDREHRVACVGNSSSGIKETPAFGCPTVNIGSRQQGRLRGDNVLDTGYDRDEIVAAVNRCMFDEAFRAACRAGDNPYHNGSAAAAIAEVLATVPLDQKLLRKRNV